MWTSVGYWVDVVVSSAPEAEFGAAFSGATHMLPMIQTLIFWGHPQKQVRVTMDNKAAVGIANSTTKPRRSKAMDMRFHWLCCREAQQQFQFVWDKGANNLADYFTKIHPLSIYRERRPLYVVNSISSLEGVSNHRHASHMDYYVLH